MRIMIFQSNFLSWSVLVFFTLYIPGALSVGFLSPLQNKTAIEGSTVALKCKIKSDGKTIKRTWTNNTSVIYANSIKFRVDDRIKLTKDNHDEYTIQLRSVTRYDEGKYTCTLYLEPPQKSFMYLTVNVPPKISPDIKTNIKVDEESDVNLKCTATGKPEPTISWRHLVPSADGIWARGPYLPLQKINRESAGAYECTADNKVSAPDTRRIQVTVRYPPELDERKGNKIVEQSLGLKATLECTAMSVPEPEFEWFHPSLNKYQDGSVGRIRVLNFKRGGTVTSRLLISEVGLRDFGNYSCNAKNRMGSASKRILLKRIILPATRPPPNYFFSNMFGRSNDNGNSASSNKLSSSTFKLMFFCITLLLIKILILH